MASRRGADFERKVRDLFVSHGYEVVRSTVSKSPADLVVLATGGADVLLQAGRVRLRTRPLLVQAKIGGKARFSPADWNELYTLAAYSGSWPVLASQQKEGRRHVVALDLLMWTRTPNSREWPLERLTWETCDAP